MLDTSFGLGSWKVTPEQAERIQAHSMPDMVQFWEENTGLIDYYATQYLSRKADSEYGYTVEDMKQQLLLDLPYFDSFGSAGAIASNVRRSFFYSALGGYSQLKNTSRNSLEPGHFSRSNTDTLYRIGEDGEEYCWIDLRISDPSFDVFLDVFRCVKPYEIKLLFRPYMSPRVYTYFCYRLDGYTMRETLRKMGVSVTCSSYHRQMRYTICAHYDELLDYLRTHESDYVDVFVTLGAELLEEIRAKEAKTKEKALQRTRARRERMKGSEAYKAENAKYNNTPERKAYMQEYRRKRREAALASRAEVRPC